MMRRQLRCLALPVAASLMAGLVIGRFSASWVQSIEVQSPIPNVDFHLMVIATKPFIATALRDVSAVPVKAWERCALGLVSCDAPRRTVEAHCLGSGQTVLIEEQDWSALQRIPEEDLPGLIGIQPNMSLCKMKHL